MTLTQDRPEVERRKVRPFQDSIIDLLNRFGTEYPEPEIKAAEYRKNYYDLLARTWTPRGRGLSQNAFLAVTILAACLLFLAGGIALILLTQSGAAGSYRMSLLSFLAIGVWGLIISGVMLYVLSIWNINKRTRANSFRKYPQVRRAAYQLADSSKGEVVRDYIPILKIAGGTYFKIVYIRKGDPTKTPTGILILDDQGRAILKYGVLENTKLTAAISITCGNILQQRAEIVRRSMKNVVDKQIPDAVGVLKNQEQQFAERGLTPRWTSVMEGAAILPQALEESITILDGEAAFRKAMGYAFALEFQYEDALKLRELYLSYVKYLNSAYRRKIFSLTTEAAMLIQILEAKTDWPNQKAALAALSTLAVAGTNGLLSRVCQKEYEGIVIEGERMAYEEKTLQAKNTGWPVVSE
jgi:hypothetical protein